MKRLLLLIVLSAAITWGQNEVWQNSGSSSGSNINEGNFTPTGIWNYTNGTLLPPSRAIPFPPAGQSVGLVYRATNANSAYDCTAGGGTGTFQPWCQVISGAWVPMFPPSVGTGDVSSIAGAYSDGQLSVNNGTSGKSLKPLTGTGVMKMVAGVPSPITGASADCIKVDTTSGPCGSPSGAVGDVIAVPSSATPVLAVPSATLANPTFLINLAASPVVISSTLTGAVQGQQITYIVCQDATGGRPWVPPPNFVNAHPITSTRNSAPNMCYRQTFSYTATATAVGQPPVNVGLSGALAFNQQGEIDIVPAAIPTKTGANVFTGDNKFDQYIDLKFGAAPGNPPATYGRFYADTADSKVHCKTSTGTSCDAASGGGLTPLTSNRVSTINELGWTGSTVTVTAALRIRGFWFQIHSANTFTNIVGFIGTNGGAGTSAGWGLYSRTGTLVCQSGVQSAAISNQAKVAACAATVQPGLYVWAWGAENTTMKFGGLSLGTFPQAISNLSTGPYMLVDFPDTDLFSITTGMPATLNIAAMTRAAGDVMGGMLFAQP